GRDRRGRSASRSRPTRSSRRDTRSPSSIDDSSLPDNRTGVPMSRRVLISGSVAYDTIMVFEGHFRDHILPDRVHMLNVAFLTPRLKREFGGCAANIAYNLVGLGGHPVVLATIGRDGDDYLSRLGALGIDVSQVRRLDEHYTAQAFITTDLSDH